MSRNKVVSDEKQQLQMKKVSMMMRAVFYGQFVIVAVVVLYLSIRYIIDQTMPDFLTYIGLLILLSVLVIMNGAFLMRDKNMFTDLNNRLVQQGTSYEQVKELNKTLRAQRHDFLNHIQVLYTLMELEEYEDTRAYLDNLYKDVGKVSARIKTKSVAVNALLQAKGNEAESKGIDFEVVIKTRFDQFTVPDWELCRIIANVIDNAFEATKAVDDPKVKVVIEESVVSYELTVINDCMPIGNVPVEKLFEAGYTSKTTKEGHGMGLYIVKNLVEKYGGFVELNLAGSKAEALIRLPKVTTET